MSHCTRCFIYCISFYSKVHLLSIVVKQINPNLVALDSKHLLLTSAGGGDPDSFLDGIPLPRFSQKAAVRMPAQGLSQGNTRGDNSGHICSQENSRGSWQASGPCWLLAGVVSSSSQSSSQHDSWLP